MVAGFSDELRSDTGAVSRDLMSLAESIPPGHFRFVSAPAGSGKTTLLRAWRADLRAEGIAVAWIPLTPAHSDPALLIEDWVEAIREALRAADETEARAGRAPDPPPESEPPFGTELLGTSSVLGDRDPAAWALHAERALRGVSRPLCLAYDNLHLVSGRGLEVLEQLFRTERDDGPMGLVASRGARTPALTRALASGRAIELDGRSLALDRSQVQTLVEKQGLELAAAEVDQVLEATGGWATGVVLALRRLAAIESAARSDFLADFAQASDLFGYLAAEVVAEESPVVLALLDASSVLGPVPPRILLKAVPDSDSDVLEDALRRGVLLSEDGDVLVHHLWEAFFRDRMKARLDEESRAAFLMRLGHLVTEVDPARAVTLFSEANASEELAQLLTDEGIGWWERGYRDLLDSAFRGIPPEIISARPRLELVAALQVSARDPEAGLSRLSQVSEVLRKLGDREGEDVALHRGVIVAGNASQEEWLGKFIRRLITLRRLASDPAARAMGLLGLALASFFSGRYKMGARLIKSIDRGVIPGEAEQAAPVFALSVMHRHYGTWDAELALCDEALSGTLPVTYPPARQIIVMYGAFVRGLRRAAGASPGRCGTGSADESLAELRDARDALRSFGLALSDEQASASLVQLLAETGRYEDALAELDRSFSGGGEARAWVGHAHAEILRASILMRTGHEAAALEHAQGVLATYEAKKPSEFRQNPMTWSCAVAAWLVAELGDLSRAQDFVSKKAAGVQGPNAPLIRHATHLCRARIASLAGDEGLAQKHLRAAWKAARSGPIIDAAPEIRGPLLEWAFEESKRLGIESIAAMRETSVAGETAALSIRTLGRLEVSCADSVVANKAWRGKPSRRLLARLLIAGSSGISRERLQDDLWPELSPEKAANNLRVALSRLRAVLETVEDEEGEAKISAENGHLGLSESMIAAWDVTQLESELRLAEAGDGGALEHALDLYQGPFLGEFYEDWVLELRSHLEARILRVGTRFVEAHQKRRDWGRSATAARRLLSVDGASEVLWCAVVEGDVRRGNSSAAIRTIEEARTVLRRELDVEESARLDALEAEARST